jgi:WD40 repeat protein
MTVVRTLACLALSLALSPALAPAGQKPAVPDKVSYYRDVRPIFQQHCQGCHQPAKAKGSFVMISYPDLLKAGEHNKPVVVPGQPDRSLILSQIIPHGKKPPAMPKGQDPLIDRDVHLIRTWIAQGAADDTPTAAREVVDAEHPPTYLLPPVITALDYSPDGQLLAVAGRHEVLLHKLDGSGVVARLIGLSERVQSLAFAPDGKQLAVSGGDPGRFGEVQIWDVKRRKLAISVPVTHDTVYGVSWSPDGSKVAFGCGDNTLRAIDAKTGKQVLYQGAHNDWVLGTVFSKDGSHLVSVSRDMSMKLIEVATQRFVDNITSITPGALKGGLQSVARHPTKDELLIGGSDSVPKIYKMYRTQARVIGDDFNFLQSFDALPGRIFAVRYSPDGLRVAAASSFEGMGEVRVYQASTGAHPQFAALAALPVLAGRLSPLFYATDFRTNRLVSRFEGQQGGVFALAYRPDGKQVASAGFDGVVRLNDVETGKLVKEFVPVPLSRTVTVTSKK